MSGSQAITARQSSVILWRSNGNNKEAKEAKLDLGSFGISSLFTALLALSLSEVPPVGPGSSPSYNVQALLKKRLKVEERVGVLKTVAQSCAGN